MDFPGKQSPSHGAAYMEPQLSECETPRGTAEPAQEYFRFFAENVRDYAFITLDKAACITSWSRGAQEIFGYCERDVLGKHGRLIFTPEDRSAGQAEAELAQARAEGCAEDERWHVRRDGTRFWASGIVTAHRDQHGAIQAYSKVLRDQTAQKISQDRLHQSEERFRLFSENVTDYALVPMDVHGNVSGWNTGAARIFGYTEQQILGRSAACFFTPEDAALNASENDLRRAADQGRSEDARWMVRSDGSRFWARWVTTPIRVADQLRGFTKVLRDETERKRAEDLLQSTLESKDLLLREIHHRVKNHVQVIASLISMQARQAKEAHIQELFKELQHRVRAIGSLHETLYGSEDLANIEFGPYVREVLHGLISSHGASASHVDLRIETEDVILSSEQALALGLIANELVSNALKHGKSGAPVGSVQVGFRYLPETADPGHSLDDGWCELAVRDDGSGITNPDGIWERQSMGLRIVRLLTEQLHGTVHLDQSHGTCFIVRFPLS